MHDEIDEHCCRSVNSDIRPWAWHKGQGGDPTGTEIVVDKWTCLLLLSTVYRCAVPAAAEAARCDAMTELVTSRIVISEGQTLFYVFTMMIIVR